MGDGLKENPSPGPCPHGSRRGLVFSRPFRGWGSGRFIASPLFEFDLLTALEPEGIPGGGTSVATDAQSMAGFTGRR